MLIEKGFLKYYGIKRKFIVILPKFSLIFTVSQRILSKII